MSGHIACTLLGIAALVVNGLASSIALATGNSQPNVQSRASLRNTAPASSKHVEAWRKFIDLWTYSNVPPKPIKLSQFDVLAKQHKMQLPRDYIEVVTRLGLPWPKTELLNTLAQPQSKFYPIPVTDFHKPAEIASVTLGWRKLGLPHHLIAFASDESGNLFCFENAMASRSDGNSKVYYWDHDFRDTRLIANSLTRWLTDFNDLKAP